MHSINHQSPTLNLNKKMSVPSCPSTGTTNGCVSVAEADAYCTGAPQCTDINKEYNSLSDKKDKCVAYAGCSWVDPCDTTFERQTCETPTHSLGPLVTCAYTYGTSCKRASNGTCEADGYCKDPNAAKGSSCPCP